MKGAMYWRFLEALVLIDEIKSTCDGRDFETLR